MALPRFRSLLRSRALTLSCSAGFAFLGLGLLVPLFMDPETPSIRLSAGPSGTRRHLVATRFRELAAEKNLDIELLPNAGSEKCLDLLKANQLDAAIVSNGVVVPDDEDIVVLGSMHLESVHLLVRKELAESGPLLKTIRGKRVNLGDRGSTEWLLSHDLLSFSNLCLPSSSHPGDVIPTEFTKSQLLDMSRAIIAAEGSQKDALVRELPDCLIVLASMPSDVVQHLIEAADYQILPLRETRAFLLDTLQDNDSGTTVLEREFLEPTSIASFSYFTDRGYPSTDCETIGVRLLLVARKDLASSKVRPLMETLLDSEFTHRIQAKSPREVATPYPIHPAAIAFLDRNQPLIVNAVLDGLSNFLSVFGALIACGLSLLSLLWRAKTRNPSDYFTEIRKIEQLAREGSPNPSQLLGQPELLQHLDERLLRLRHDLLEDICEGRIKGDQVISNIMLLLKEARRSLIPEEARLADSRDRERLLLRRAA